MCLVCTCHGACVEIREQLGEVSSLFLPCGAGAALRSRLGIKLLYPLSLLAAHPHHAFFFFFSKLYTIPLFRFIIINLP